jgi:hypothetical protein
MARERNISGPAASSAVRLTAHPPERHRRAGPVILPCACCCCCCCCLHSVGSVIGGLVGSVKQLDLPPREITDPDFPFPFRRDEVEEEGPIVPVGIVYWLLVAFLLAVGAVWYFLGSGSGRVQDLLTGLIIGLCLLPIPQLGASILASISVFLFYADRRAAFARLGYITLYSFVGTMIGLMLLGAFCGLLSLGGGLFR